MSIPMIYELEMWIPHWGSGASDLSESRKTSTCPSRWQTCPSTLFITPAEMIWYCGTNPCSVGRCPNSSFSPGMHRAAFLCFGVGQGAKSSGQGQATVNGNYMDNTCATLMITWTILGSIDNTWAPIGTYMDHLEQCWGKLETTSDNAGTIFTPQWDNFESVQPFFPIPDLNQPYIEITIPVGPWLSTKKASEITLQHKKFIPEGIVPKKMDFHDICQ